MLNCLVWVSVCNWGYVIVQVVFEMVDGYINSVMGMCWLCSVGYNVLYIDWWLLFIVMVIVFFGSVFCLFWCQCRMFVSGMM